MVAHLIHRRASYMVVYFRYACISYIGVLLTHRHASHTGMHLRYSRASHSQTCISGIAVHLTHRHASQVWVCISGIGVHLGYRRASRVCTCISGGRNEALKGRTQVCRHQREDVGHSLAEIITPNFPIQIGESEVVDGA